MKRILTVQDISCVGKCSLTVALPIISAAGVECAVLPTAVLSNHTAFPSFTFCDLTEELPVIEQKFHELGFDFSAIYTGYLGSLRQIDIVRSYFNTFSSPDCLKVIDPVMADHGKLYYGFTQEFADNMCNLCREADIILPNLSEASFMLHTPYLETYTEEQIRDLLHDLGELGPRYVALTGISFAPDEIGVYAYDRATDEYHYYKNEKLPVAFHGTGDIYASLFLGALMRGHSVFESLDIAVDFTLLSMKKTLADPNYRTYGVNFEEVLGDYAKAL